MSKDLKAMVEELEQELIQNESDHHIAMEGLFEELDEKNDEIDDLYDELADLRKVLEVAIPVDCPVCFGVIYRDVIDGLICRECRRTFELKERE